MFRAEWTNLWNGLLNKRKNCFHQRCKHKIWSCSLSSTVRIQVIESFFYIIYICFLFFKRQENDMIWPCGKLIGLRLFGKCESCQHLHLVVAAATNYSLSKQESQLGLLSRNVLRNIYWEWPKMLWANFTPWFLWGLFLDSYLRWNIFEKWWKWR